MANKEQKLQHDLKFSWFADAMPHTFHHRSRAAGVPLWGREQALIISGLRLIDRDTTALVDFQAGLAASFSIAFAVGLWRQQDQA